MKVSIRSAMIVTLLSVLFLSLVVAHFTAEASAQEKYRENRLSLDSLEAKTIKVGGITISAEKGYSGIWLTTQGVPGAVSMYVAQGQGPCIGIHRNPQLSAGKGPDGFDLALTANPQGEAIVQYRKKDGSLGHLTVVELDKIVQSRN